jgi:hypothetical protein
MNNNSMEAVQLISILMEAAVVVLGVKIATEKKKQYGWFIALTFGVYVVYDMSNLFNFGFPSGLLRTLFFIASASILYAVWQLYKKK